MDRFNWDEEGWHTITIGEGKIAASVGGELGRHSKRVELYQHYIWTEHELYMDCTWSVLEHTYTIHALYPGVLYSSCTVYFGAYVIFLKGFPFLKMLSYALIFLKILFLAVLCATFLNFHHCLYKSSTFSSSTYKLLYWTLLARPKRKRTKTSINLTHN